MRRLHRADGRQAREIVPFARGSCGGTRNHDDRRLRARRATSSVASRLYRARRLPVRLLHVRADHGRRRLHQRGSCWLATGDPRLDEREPLPLRSLQSHRPRHPRCGAGQRCRIRPAASHQAKDCEMHPKTSPTHAAGTASGYPNVRTLAMVPTLHKLVGRGTSASCCLRPDSTSAL